MKITERCKQLHDSNRHVPSWYGQGTYFNPKWIHEIVNDNAGIRISKGERAALELGEYVKDGAEITGTNRHETLREYVKELQSIPDVPRHKQNLIVAKRWLRRLDRKPKPMP